jgi:hypothetical protein
MARWTPERVWAGVRRRWSWEWALGPLVTLVVLVAAFYAYAGPPASGHQMYLVTQSLQLMVLPADGTNIAAATRAQADEARVAMLLAEGNGLSSGPLEAAIAARLLAQHTALPAASGALSPAVVTAGEIGAALSARHAGGLVTLTCRWSSPVGARLLCIEATNVLTRSADLRTLVPASASVSGAVQAHAEGQASQPALDPAVRAAADEALLLRVGLAVLAGALLSAGVWWGKRGGRE